MVLVHTAIAIAIIILLIIKIKDRPRFFQGRHPYRNLRFEAVE